MKKQLHSLQRWQRQLSEREQSIRLQMLTRSKRPQRTKRPSKQAASETQKANAALNSAQHDFNETQAKNDADKADLNKAESEKNQAATDVKDAQEKYNHQKRNEASANQISSAKVELESAQKAYEETLSEYKTLVSEKGQADSKDKEAK